MKKITFFVLAFSCSLSFKAQIVSTFAGDGTVGNIDGQSVAAKFNYPIGVAIDASDNVYVADAMNKRIRKITPAGMVSTFAGSSLGYADGQGSAAKFAYPTSVAVDANGNVYVADRDNHRIRKISSTGAVTTLAGSTQGYADGQGALAKFNTPNSVAVDVNGNVYVADEGNYCIRKISSTGLVTTWAGGIPGYADGQGTAAQFDTPKCVAVDVIGNVYVGDLNHRIRKISPTASVTTLAGNYLSGSTDGIGTAAKFISPSAITVDLSGNVYVADAGSLRIRKISPTASVTTLAGSTTGYADGPVANALFSFGSGSGLALDAAGNLYIGDCINQRIRMINIGTVSVNDLLNPVNYSIYPNPSNGTLNIDFSDMLNETGQTIIQIMNPLGQTVYYQNVLDSKITINTEDFSKGIYVVSINNGKVKATKKIIIQ